MVDYFGRKTSALIVSFPFILGWTAIAFAPTVFILISGRFVTGRTKTKIEFMINGLNLFSSFDKAGAGEHCQ